MSEHGKRACGCGNTARLGTTMCGRCQDQSDARQEHEEARVALHHDIESMKTGADLKAILHTLANKAMER